MNDSKAKGHPDALLPLRLEMTKLAKDQYQPFKLRTNPAQASNPTHEVNVPYIYGTEGPRAAIQFSKDIERLCVGMNITTVDKTSDLTQKILKDQALPAYVEAFHAALAKEFEAVKEITRMNRIAVGDDEAAVEAAVAAVREPDATEECHL